MKIGVLGAGGWGSALANLLAGNGHEVIVWSIDEREVAMLKEFHEQRDRLPGVILNSSIEYTTDASKAVIGQKMIVCAVPSPFVRSTAKNIADKVSNGQLIVNVSKGIEESTLKALVEIIEEEIPQAKVAVLSGPSHAEEVGRGIPTTVVAGARDIEIAKTIQPQFKDTPVEKIATIVDRYKSQDTWKENTVFEKDSFELLENILEESGELKKRVPYEKLVRTDFSINAVNVVQK